MIRQYYVTGDTHGSTYRFEEFCSQVKHPEEIAFIILGDAGLNFYLNLRDMIAKNKLLATKATYYLVRGNHEERPENLPDIMKWHDNEIKGEVYLQPEWQNIRYLMDGGVYVFHNHKTLVIGGAYSVDKYYRLERHLTWFPQEQLTVEEMTNIKKEVSGGTFDFVLTHTCPLDWEPTDLFLSSVDQSTVDNTMEHQLANIRSLIHWGIWLFGHFHADRWERPKVQMLYYDIENLEDIWERWQNDNWFTETHSKSPYFYY